jgi:hypothetical protein
MQQGMVGLQNQTQNPNFTQQRQQNQQWFDTNINLLGHGGKYIDRLKDEQCSHGFAACLLVFAQLICETVIVVPGW